MYWLDYLGTLQEVDYGAHGYAAYFVMSILTSMYKEDLSREEAVEIIKHCIHELRTRFMIAQDNFIIKVINKDGVEVLAN